MGIGYKSEVGAVCAAGVAAVCFTLMPRQYLALAVPVWLVAQRLVARGSRNRSRPPHKGDICTNNSSINSDRPVFVLSRDMKDEERPVAVVTGTNSGIGYHTAVGLAVEGYRVVCTCRSAALSEATAARISKEAEETRQRRNGDANYAQVPEKVLVDGRFCLECDDFVSIRRFVEEFQKAYTRLDVLVNNAGMMRKRLEFSKHNPQLELHTAVNFLGPLLLTELLVPLIQRSKGRVVFVSSAAHRFPQMMLERGWWWHPSSSLTCINGRLLEALKTLNQGEDASSGPLRTGTLSYAFVRYGTSKLLNTYHAHYIARHHKLPVCSLHPGCVGTNFSKDLVPSGWIYRAYQYACLLFLKSPEEGAQTTLHCAMCDVEELKPVEPPKGQGEPVSPYFGECGNQTSDSLLRYGWDVEEGDRIVLWGKRLVGLPVKEE